MTPNSISRNAQGDLLFTDDNGNVHNKDSFLYNELKTNWEQKLLCNMLILQSTLFEISNTDYLVDCFFESIYPKLKIDSKISKKAYVKSYILSMGQYYLNHMKPIGIEIENDDNSVEDEINYQAITSLINLANKDFNYAL